MEDNLEIEFSGETTEITIHPFLYKTINQNGKKVVYEGELEVIEGDDLTSQEETYKINWKGEEPKDGPDAEDVFDELDKEQEDGDDENNEDDS